MFEDRVKTLAFRSDIRIKEISNSGAKLTFVFDENGRKTERNCYITPFRDGKYWEFDCLSPIDEGMMSRELCQYLLKENSIHFRGFWCLEKIGDDNTLVYMHNVASELLTPDEFAATCWDVTRRVDELVRKFT
jgi:hypothetical protein